MCGIQVNRMVIDPPIHSTLITLTDFFIEILKKLKNFKPHKMAIFSHDTRFDLSHSTKRNVISTCRKSTSVALTINFLSMQIISALYGLRIKKENLT